MALAASYTTIFPSPILPVRSVSAMTSMARSTSQSRTRISSLSLGRNLISSLHIAVGVFIAALPAESAHVDTVMPIMRSCCFERRRHFVELLRTNHAGDHLDAVGLLDRRQPHVQQADHAPAAGDPEADVRFVDRVRITDDVQVKNAARP